MTKFTIGCATLAGALTLAGCSGFGDAMTAHTDLVARAGDHELTVDETVDLFALNSGIRPDPDVVNTIAGFWIDYVLLATAVNDDSALESVDLAAVVQPQLDQELVERLREEVIQIDTALTDEELRTIYETEQPNAEIRARHILLRVPEGASDAQRDSVMALARELRERAVAGEPFAELARQYSDDTGSAQRGGDLDYFPRGRMVAPFEDAAFALDSGEVGDVVETPFGYHIIKLVDRRMPAFDDVRDDFRSRLQGQRVAEAEESYVRELTEPREITVEDGAYDIARELASNPEAELGRRARDRALVSYDGGEVTAGEYRDLVRRLPIPQRGRYSQATDDQIEPVLQATARNEIIVAEAARRLPDAASPERRDSLEAELRVQLKELGNQVGLTGAEPRDGETAAAAVERAGTDLLRSMLAGERGIIPLGSVGYALREHFGAETFERNVSVVLEGVREMRAAADSAGNDSVATPDTTGGS